MKYEKYNINLMLPVAVSAVYGLSRRALTKGGEAFSDGSATVRLYEAENGVAISVASKKPISAVKLSWSFPSSAKKVRVFGDALERLYGKSNFKPIGEQHDYYWFFVGTDEEVTLCYGVKTGTNSIAFWHTSENGIELTLDLRNGSMPVLLSDRILEAATLVSHFGGDDVFSVAREFADKMCDKPLLPKKPVYGFNNWYYAYGHTDKELLKKDADLLASLTEGIENRPYMVIDDGWMDSHMSKYGRRKAQTWEPHMERIGDMRFYPQYFEERGLIPGIWYRPLLVTKNTDKKLLIKRFSSLYKSPSRVMDPSIKENLRTVTKDIKKLIGWGYKLIKHDFSTWDIFLKWGREDAPLTCDFWHMADRSRTNAEIVKDFYRTIREAAGEDAIIIGCNTISHLSAGLFELQRTGDDTSGYDWNRVIRCGAKTIAYRSFLHGKFYASDADCIGIMQGDKIPWKRNEKWLKLLASSGTPLFASIDPRVELTEEQRTAFKEAFLLASKADGEPIAPVDALLHEVPTLWKKDGEIIKIDFYEE